MPYKMQSNHSEYKALLSYLVWYNIYSAFRDLIAPKQDLNDQKIQPNVQHLSNT